MADDEDDKKFWKELIARAPGIDHANARAALHRAKLGDWRSLEKRVRSNVKLNIKEREFVADTMAGKIKRPSHHYQDLEADCRLWEIACYVVWGKPHNGQKKAIVADAMASFGVSRSGVYAALRKYREEAEEYRNELLSHAASSKRAGQDQMERLVFNFYWKPGERTPKRDYPGLEKGKRATRTARACKVSN